MKKILISLSLALLLVAVIAMPATAVDEQTVGASVSVGEVVSITLTDAGTAGINFGSVSPDTEDVGDVDQSDGTPAIQVIVETETNINVDIAVKGSATGSLALTEWEYSTDFAGTKTSIPADYGTPVYADQGVGGYAFYHWVDVPESTPAGTQGCTVYYKAVATGNPF